MATPDLAIGSGVWPGVAKLIEECGELQQILGKLAAYPAGDHPDGAGDLRARLVEEMADVAAAIEFVAEINHLDTFALDARTDEKLARFRRWHDAERRAPSTDEGGSGA